MSDHERNSVVSCLIESVIEVVATGHELLDGTIADTNTQRLSLALRPLGLCVSRITVVSDGPQDIVEAVTLAVARASVTVISGGLGPTSDDRTLEVVAKAFGTKQVFNRQAKANIIRRLKKIKRSLNRSNLKQAWIPQGAQVLSNEEGTAPGISWKVGDRQLFFLPGVPREFQHVLDRHLIPWFKKRAAAEKSFLFVFKIFGWRESELNELIQKMKVPKDVEVGFRTHLPENHLKFEVKVSSWKEAQKKTFTFFQQIRKKLGLSLFSESEKTFEEVMFEKLLKQKANVALAESCTGGLASEMLTRVSGSSKVLDRSFVTYSDRSKVELLGVSEQTLKKHGAVSREVAVEMAEGALKNSQATRAVAITGIAGPTGGSRKKPVGIVWIAAVTSCKVKTKLLQLGFDRDLNRKFSAYQALQMIADIEELVDLSSAKEREK